jgi:hypothetical protein
MANNLGSLVVSLGLDAAEFTSGLSKSEYQAKKFAQQMDRAVASGVIKAEIALRAAGAAAEYAFAAFRTLTTGAGDFADLSDKTGASAESLASLAVSAATAGVSMEDVAGSVNKLTKNLVGVDDESKAAGAALAALNISVAEFKKLSPTEQYQAVGKALGEYADGAAKVAVAQALFGKSGAEQLRVFKALQEAGGAQVILTQRQIEQADAYADQQAKTTAQLRLYAQAAASEAVPALVDLTKVAAELARAFLGVDETSNGLAANNGAKVFAEGVADALAFAIDQADLFVRLFQLAGRAVAGYAAVSVLLAKGQFAEAKAAGEAFRADIDGILNKITFGERLARQRVQSAEDKANQGSENERRLNKPKPTLDFAGAVRGGSRGGGAKAARSFTDYASEVSQAVAKLVEDADVVRIAKLNDQLRELDKLQAAGLNSGIAAEARAAIFAKLPQQVESAAEAFRRFELAATDAVNNGLATEKLKAYNDEQERLNRLLEATPTAQLEKQRDDMKFLADQLDRGKISAEQFSEAASARLGMLGKDAEKTKSIFEEMGASFSSAFEDAIVAGRGFSGILKGLEQDIVRIITRQLVTEPLGQAFNGLFSGGGGGIGAGIGSFISSIFGGGLAGGGPAEAGMLYRVNERRPEMLDVGGRQFLMMGSQRGRVDPNPQLAGRSQTVYNQFTLTGPVDRRTQNQIAGSAARGVAVANARMN